MSSSTWKHRTGTSPDLSLIREAEIPGKTGHKEEGQYHKEHCCPLGSKSLLRAKIDKVIRHKAANIGRVEKNHR